MTRVKVLGRIDVTEDDGRSLGADDLPRRARQVLGVLAARYDRVQSKDALADAVWGESLPGNHGAALEHYVSVLRRRLEPGRSTVSSFIVTRSGGYVFDSSRAWLDLAELRRLVRVADGHAPGAGDRLAARQQILDLGTDLPFGEEDYAEWARGPRDEVRSAILAALLELSDAVRDDDSERALRLAREATEIDPYVEQAYRLAMQASAALGRTDDALRWFERCRRVLDEELGIAPSAETVWLQRELLAHRHEPPAAPQRRARLSVAPFPRAVLPTAQYEATVPVRGDTAAQPFFGREDEIELVLCADPIPVVHVVGPAGAGKSALLSEIVRRAPERVAVGWGGRATGALRLEWLRAALVQFGASGGVLTGVDEATDARRTLSQDELELIAGVLDRDVPVVLAVDDAQLLDEDSVTELAWLRRRCPRLSLVLAYRYPSAISGRPVAELVARVVLRLAPLTAEELEASGQPDLAQRTGGIPALVEASRRPGPVATSVAMHVARLRTEWMGPVGWDILRLCAALGALRADQLADLSGHSVPVVLDGVDRLLHAHLVVEGPGGRIRHRSELVRDAVAEQVSIAHSLHLRERLVSSGA
jgi:DNA-binding SARP family transcriptional activator